MSFFSANKITAGYGTRHVIKDVSFELENGCLMGVLGSNGSGKTTLLKSVCGILPHDGNCVLDGKPLEALAPRQIAKLCSYIPQRSGIEIDISVLDVVFMGFNPQLGLLERPDAGMTRKAQQALETVGLAQKADTNYLHLSEGQKQLCILARTLVADSKLLLLDEPESSLDFRYRYRMLDILRRWVEETKNAVVVTLHDPALALNYCDKLLLLSEGTVLGTIAPNTDSMGKMEEMLAVIYGPVSLQTCKTRSGQPHLLMLKEDER